MQKIGSPPLYKTALVACWRCPVIIAWVLGLVARIDYKILEHPMPLYIPVDLKRKMTNPTDNIIPRRELNLRQTQTARGEKFAF
jgi:hypothetical protein